MHAIPSTPPAIVPRNHPHRRRTGLRMAAFFLLSAVVPASHFVHAQSTTVHDPAALKPPPGARVAIVEFEDMECPDCARANPLLRDAATQSHIPWCVTIFPCPSTPGVLMR